MKRLIASFIAGACAFTNVAYAGSLEDLTPVAPSKVLLSNSGAMLFASETVQVSNGTFSVILPTNTAPSSFVLKTAGLSIADIEEEIVPVNANKYPLVKQRQDLQEKIRKITVQIQAIDARVKLITSSQQVFTSAQDINRIDSAVNTKIVALYEEKNTLTTRKLALEKSLRELDAVLRKSLGSTNPEFRKCTVTLTDKNIKGSKSIAYSYVTHSAGWRPKYQIDANVNDKTVMIRFFAEVWQRMPVTWNKADIVITTADINAAVTPNAVPSWELGVIQQETAVARSYASADVMTLEWKAGNDVRTNSASSVEWKLGKQTLQAGSPRVIAISSATWSADFSYMVRPYISNQAYLVAALKSNSNSDIFFPAGSAEFTVEGVNTGRGTFAYVEQSDNRVYFGADPLVTSSMILKKEGLQSTKKEQTRSWVWNIQVTNKRSTPVNVVVEEAKPKTNSPKIQISYDKSSPVPQEGENAVLVWKFSNLKPKGTAEIRFNVTAVAPLDIEISSVR